MSESDEIKDVRAEELGRAKRPAERITRRQHIRILNALQKALEKRDRSFYERIIRDEIGLQPGSERYIRAMALWDEEIEP